MAQSSFTPPQSPLPAAGREASPESESGSSIGRSVTVGRPVGELYAFWREWTNLAKLSDTKAVVKSTADRRSLCVITRGGTDYDIEGVIDEDLPNQRIVWHMEADSEPIVEGRIEFRPAAGERGTVTTVNLLERHRSKTLQKIARLFQHDAQSHAMQELRRFKQWTETGEIATAEPLSAAPGA